MSDWMETVREQYRTRGVGERLAAGRKSGVVVVDLINGFTDPACPPGSDLDTVVGHTAELLGWAREAGFPVFFTTISYEPQDLDELVWLRKMPTLRVLTAGSRWVEVDQRLAPRSTEPVIAKKAASAFHGTDLAEHLAAAGVDSLIVCGATTSGCIRATVIDACAGNYPVRVPRECVGDRAEGPHEANLFDIDAKYADVVSLDEVMAA
ncbi:isochorismatase family protein [Streptomyces sp. NPDC002917]|uniref:isochorismatase family protein n=1 Tax=unclassified Streptomyces TaxID=2593676 RepID=UPI002E8243F2|nr:isochorismatase family protein [Streptomyces sp. NBC_00562]WTD31892.1 isochorismatase family protein [Streptomyces sp. NBC_01643]WUC18498.1 isochorismatase family protein [Streptomyces sp. NBC_00562]